MQSGRPASRTGLPVRRFVRSSFEFARLVIEPEPHADQPVECGAGVDEGIERLVALTKIGITEHYRDGACTGLSSV